MIELEWMLKGGDDVELAALTQGPMAITPERSNETSGLAGTVKKR
jgi:hypothetical protein